MPLIKRLGDIKNLNGVFLMVKVRKTKQRRLILEELQKTTCHPSAEWLHRQVQAKMPRISLGTVYRNLAVLKEMGAIQELPRVGNQSRYDGNPQPHYHFLCVQCNRIDDLTAPALEEVSAAVAQQNKDYAILGHITQFYGYCPDCKKRTQKPQPDLPVVNHDEEID